MRTDQRRYFGHPDLVMFIQRLSSQVSNLGMGTVLIGDMGMPAGGRFNGGHASHQTGLDVDIFLQLPKTRWTSAQLLRGTVLIGDMGMPAGGRFNGGHASHQTGLDVDIFLQLPKTRWTSAQLLRTQALDLVSRDGKHVVSTLWKPEIFSLIKLAAQDKDVTRIFVNPAIKQQLCLDAGTDRDWLRKVRPWFQHRAHMHVRLRCPADSLEPIVWSVRINLYRHQAMVAGQNCKAGLNLQNREQQSLRRRHRLRCRLPPRRYWMST